MAKRYSPEEIKRKKRISNLYIVAVLIYGRFNKKITYDSPLLSELTEVEIEELIEFYNSGKRNGKPECLKKIIKNWNANNIIPASNAQNKLIDKLVSEKRMTHWFNDPELTHKEAIKAIKYLKDPLVHDNSCWQEC